MKDVQEVKMSLLYQENEAVLGKDLAHLQPVSFSRLCIVVYGIKCLQLMHLRDIALQFLCVTAVKMFPCSVCDVELNSAEQLRAHCRGKNHIKREEARKKAEELGTDFDSTPDHCDVCNVPLTSKMTAIDHFKGKMHQKKVKAVEEQRQGFKNYCEICERPLQSLKVSEAHFKGKQHHKRVRKTYCGKGQGKKIPIDRNCGISRTSRTRTEDFSPSENIFGLIFEETPMNSSSWENLNCDNDSEAKDLFSEFRNFITSGKSPNSPITPSSSSPESSTEPFFSFDIPVVSSPSIQISPNGNHTVVQETIPGKQLSVVETSSLQSTPYINSEGLFNGIKSTPLDILWGPRANLQHLNEICIPTFPFPSTDFLSARSQHFLQTQAVVYMLRESCQGISSGDIATKIPGLSPSDVNLILNDLEKHHLVSKSGYAPILWSLTGSREYTAPTPSKQPHKTSNRSYSEKIPSPKEPRSLESNESFFNEIGGNHFPTTEALTAAILAPCSISTTTATPIEDVRPYVDVIEPNYATMTVSNDIVHPYSNIIESNLVNVFQQNGSLNVEEIKTKLNFRDEDRLRFMLQKLLERNVIVKDGDQRWRLVSLARSNVGVIGEERKRRSPVQSEDSEILRDTTSTPPKEISHLISNGYHTTSTNSASNGFQTPASSLKENVHRVVNGFQNSAPLKGGFPNTYYTSRTLLPKNGYTEAGKHNCLWQEMNNYEMNPKAVRNAQHEYNKQPSRPSPSLPLKTETSETLEDLTVTTPKSYQKELYKIAMQEDTVCYLPCGTGKDLVIAQVIAHMAILNPTKQTLVIVPDVVSALNVAQVLRKELGSNSKRKKLNVALHAGQLKQSSGKVHVVVVTSSTCLGLLNCGALSWKDVCLLIFHHAIMCCNDEASKQILQEYFLKAKMDYREGHVPKLLSFIDSSAGQENLDETVRTFGNVLSTMGDVFLSCVSDSINELHEDKHEAMFVCVETGLSEEESKMFFLLGTYLNRVFDNLSAQWQPLNSYRELLKMSFKERSVVNDAFVKLINLTGQPLEKRLPTSCLKTWRHYLAICEVIFALVECGEDLAKDLLVNMTREQFGFAWANDVGLPGFELYRQLMEKEIPNWGSSLSNPRGSGLRELLEQLMIMQWENARVSSERPLALVIVKLSKTARMLTNYLVRCPQLVKRNVKTTFVDGSRSHQQKTVISAIKRRQYQVIVSTDNIKQDELPQCELVVLLDQPTSVYALEQLRTRRAANVVAICRDGNGEDSLKEMLRREELVEKAITCIRAGTSCYKDAAGSFGTSRHFT